MLDPNPKSKTEDSRKQPADTAADEPQQIDSSRKELEQYAATLRPLIDNEDLVSAVADDAETRSITMANVIEDALLIYFRLRPAQRARHDYAPHPNNFVELKCDLKTFSELEALARTLSTQIEHAAYFAIRRYLNQNEQLEVVHVTSGKNRTTKRIRPK